MLIGTQLAGLFFQYQCILELFDLQLEVEILLLQFFNHMTEVFSLTFDFMDFYLKILNGLFELLLIREVFREFFSQLLNAIFLTFDDLFELLDE